jgi:hypothetical protein
MTQQLIADLQRAAKGSAAIAVEETARAALFESWVERLEGKAPPLLGNYSQRDPIWRNEIFAGNLRFETDGCYVCAVADIVAMAGYSSPPDRVADALGVANCFNGANLSYPERIPNAYSNLRYDGTLQWHLGPANMTRIWDELEKGPVIAEVDFQWKTQVQNQHFVVLVEPTEDKSDIWIHDPWCGARVRLLQMYAGEHWDLARAIYGLRLLRVRDN